MPEGVKSVGRETENNMMFCLSCSTSQSTSTSSCASAKSRVFSPEVLVDLKLDAWVVLFDTRVNSVSLVRLLDKKDGKSDSVKVEGIRQSMIGLNKFVERHGSPICFTLLANTASSHPSMSENRVNILAQSWSPATKSYDCQFEVLQLEEEELDGQSAVNSFFTICDKTYPNGASVNVTVRQRPRDCAVWMAMANYSNVVRIGAKSNNSNKASVVHCSVSPLADQPADYEVSMQITPRKKGHKRGLSFRSGYGRQEFDNIPPPTAAPILPRTVMKQSNSNTKPAPQHQLRIVTAASSSPSSYLIISSPTPSSGSPALMSPVQIKQEKQHVLFVAMVQLFSLLYFFEKVVVKFYRLPLPLAIFISATLLLAIAVVIDKFLV